MFEAVEESGVKGLNEEVLTSLIAMYLKKGIVRENASPYLAPYKVLQLSFLFLRSSLSSVCCFSMVYFDFGG